MTFRATVYPPLWCAVYALLFVASRTALLVLLALLLFFDTRLNNPLRLIRAFSQFALLPGFAATLIVHACRATIEIRNGVLAIDWRTRRVEIPCDSIDSVERWPVLLPPAAVWLKLKSGRRFPFVVDVADPAAFLEAIAQAGGRHAARENDNARFAFAKATSGAALRWYHAVFKFAVFPLVPALPLFRLHQWITYGGTFGEYYLYGLKAYLLALAIYWAQAAIWLILLDTALGAIGVAATLATAIVTPAKVARVSRFARVARNVVYYGSVVVFLLRLLLLSS